MHHARRGAGNRVQSDATGAHRNCFQLTGGFDQISLLAQEKGPTDGR